MKVEQAVTLAQGIAAIMRAGNPLPTTFGFVLAVNAEKLKPACAAFDAARQKLIEEHGSRDEGGNLAVQDGNITLVNPKAYNAAMTELADQDAGVEVINISVDKLPAEMEPATVAMLLPMLTPTD